MGDNYGLNDTYDYFEFELDSLDASSSFSGQVASTDWPSFEIAGKGPIKNIAALKILEIQIPFSYYIFNEANNTFILKEADMFGTSFTSTVRLPVGNYNAIELKEILTNALNDVAHFGLTYTVEYNQNIGKFSFYNGDMLMLHSFSFTFGAGYGLVDGNGVPIPPNSGNRNPRLYIGFPPGETVSVLPDGIHPGVPLGQVIVAPNCDSVSGPNYIYVNSVRLGSDCDVFLPRGAFNLGGGAAGAQIAKVPVTTQAGGVLYWADPDPQKWFSVKGLDTITNVDFYLTLGNTTSQMPLRLNGLPFSLKLGILVENIEHVDNGGGMYNNERVFKRQGPKRIRPTY